jgi:exosortase/archaeosortase family protein
VCGFRTVGTVQHVPVWTRALAVVAGAVAVWRLVASAWRVGEATVVQGVLALLGTASSRAGDQLMVRRQGSAAFVASIGPWCSALGPVLLFAAMALVASGERRFRRAAVAATVVAAANLGRLVVVIAIGAVDDTATLERWHDGGGVAVAVVTTLGTAGWLLTRLWPMPTARRTAIR